MGQGVGLKPFLGLVEGFGGPQVEDLVVLAWVELGSLCWHPVERHFGEVVGREPCEGTDACNDHRCCIVHTDDWSVTVGSFLVGQDVGGFVIVGGIVVGGNFRRLAASLWLIITSFSSLIFLSLPLFVFGAGLVGKVLLSENMSHGK